MIACLALVGGVGGASILLMWVIAFAAAAMGLEDDSELPIFPFLFRFTALWFVIGTPAAYLVAIFRHGLWDLDVVLRKTV